MLVYVAMATELPTWAIKAIDKIRRGFLWRGRKEAKGGHCLIAWPKVCRHLELDRGAGYFRSEKTELCFKSTLAMAQENGAKQALGKPAAPGQQRGGVSPINGCHYGGGRWDKYFVLEGQVVGWS